IGTCLYGYRPNWHSESIHDNLLSTAYAFQSGETKVMFISTTVCAIRKAVCDEIAEEIEKLTGFEKENVIISATHTHSGPCLSGGEVGWGDINWEYARNIFIPQVVKSAIDAAQSMEKVTLGVASGESKVAINRRERALNGGVSLGQNPWGPVNLNMTVLSFKTEEGKIKGNIIAYGCHGTAAGNMERAITRDWSGIMTDALEEKTGAYTAFFNGTIGDAGPRLSNGKTVGDISYVEELGAVAAKDVLRIFNTITEYKDETVSIYVGKVVMPLEKREDYAWVCQKCAEHEGEQVINIDALEVNHYNEVKKSYEENYVEQKSSDIHQKIFRIGNVAFVTSPFEMFSEIGLRIDCAVNDLTVYLMSNVNGGFGYFATQSELCLGGYEIRYFMNSSLQRYTDNADFHYISGTLKNFEKLERA
ncbi:MAG: neutral/alkaline non-lysosomal ceramidase N-terminal domain-containing protein, partial [Clostridia bacterium]|nr:neutral/alkaline non-lysosomal ceramidase N-terminal domain-containing protein [Clostridia bacterium]